MRNVIEMKNIVKTYKQGAEIIYAVNQVHLTVKKGESVALTGKSGCGKTTLLNILGGLDKPDEGEYLYQGKDITELSMSRLATFRKENIGYVVQHFALIPNYTVTQNIALPLRYSEYSKSAEKQRVSELIDDLGLGGKEKSYPFELSGGQCQRVAIARAIACKPPILLADEPTGELDNQTAAEIINILMELNQNGTTLVLVTHDLDSANHCNRVLSMSDGKLIL